MDGRIPRGLIEGLAQRYAALADRFERARKLKTR
jgi:hypothetical protein